MWRVRDEFIDLAQGRHVVIHHNPDIQVPDGNGKTKPAENHLIHWFLQDSCPTCGTVHPKEMEDFAAHKDAHLKRLNDHHRQVMDYVAKHPRVRHGHGPVK